MRKLLITRGPQGAGKSTLIRALGLSGHVVCPDTIRELLASPVMGRSGLRSTSHEQEGRVWAMTRQILAERMSRGELVVVDATHRRAGDFKPYVELARQRRYQVACADFSTIPLERALAQNARRDDYRIVPPASVERTWEACRRGQVPEGVARFCWDEDGVWVEDLRAWLAEPVLDASGYAQIVHIGDLQGCWSPLAAWFERNPWRDDALYVFIGDLCDRGVENGEVVRFMLSVIDRPNARLLWGNHEDHLDAWSRGERAKSREFNERTLPQLVEADVIPLDADRICAAALDFLCYDWRGQRAFVTHGGLPRLPRQPERISTRQYSLGVGFYSDPVDARFSEQAPAGWVQIHGHRNAPNLPVQAAPRSFNLEGQVEHGGSLRILTLDDRGFTPHEIPNPRFRPLAERIRNRTVHDDLPYPPWLDPDAATPDRPDVSMPAADLAALRDHPLVYEKPAGSRPWLSAFNFTRDAFYQREWDALNVTARGLFVDTGSNEIVARSYDKFFNVGERPETQDRALAANLRFPVRVYLKENGYLGILGYSAREDDLLFASKSTPDSDFARWFEALFDRAVGPGRRELVRRYLRDTGSAMAFEVVDVENDPHIIDYEESQIVLLDLIRRSRDFQRAPLGVLQKLGRRFGLSVKQLSMRFDDWASLSGWMQKAVQPGWRYQGRHVEGFVLEDIAGFQTKMKLDYYNHWKRMRSLKQRLIAIRKSGKPLGRDITEPRAAAFYAWAQHQPSAVLEQDIGAVRRAFIANAPPPEILEPSPEPPRPSRGVIGFGRALDALVDQETIKAATADKLLAAAMADRAKLEILRTHALRTRLVLAATPGAERQAAAEAVGLDIDDVPGGD